MTARHQRTSLSVHIAAVTIAVALLGVLVSALVSASLVRSAVGSEIHSRLSNEADLVAGLRPRLPGSIRSRQLLRASGITVAIISPQRLRSGPVPLSSADLSALRAGRSISGTRTIAHRSVIVEARPLDNGGAVILAESAALPSGVAASIRDDEILALLAGLAGAVLAAVLLARWLARPLRDTARAAHRLAGGDRDVPITTAGPREVTEVGQSLAALRDALVHSESRQREFLLSVSHELRTPLTAITGFAEALSDGVATGASARDAGRTVLAESHRLERLVSDLLDLARLDAEDFDVMPTSVDLDALAADAGAVWQRRCSDVGVRWQVERPGRPLIVSTDPVRVRQIIDGLAENALRVTPAGSVIVLSVRLADPADRTSPAGLAGGADAAMVEVRDGGPGLHDDDLDVAFDRSVLYERYRGIRRSGTGLGLAIVGRLAHRLGGVATAGHAPEGGARFSVTLPGPGAVGAAGHSDHVVGSAVTPG